MPISKREVILLKQRLLEIDQELRERYSAELKYANYKPRPSDLFEHYVLYNAALAIAPDSLVLGHLSRGDFRSTGWVPMPGLKAYRTVWRAGRTLYPDISFTKEGKSASLWFDKSLDKGMRPDIVLRPGTFQVTQADSPHTAVQLLRNGKLFAEYEDIVLEEEEGHFVERQSMNWEPEGRREISFKAEDEFKHPPLILECKSYGARFGNPEKYSQYARVVVIVSPEKLYRPKAENLFIMRVESSFENSGLREQLRPFIESAVNM
jgi:hypothetical protein